MSEETDIQEYMDHDLAKPRGYGLLAVAGLIAMTVFIMFVIGSTFATV